MNNPTQQGTAAMPDAYDAPNSSAASSTLLYDLIVIGGGPAGLAAACAAWEQGLTHVLILERDKELGGILNQCIHNGFGLHHFKEELTGPEYAGRFVELLRSTPVEVRLDTMVLSLVDSEDAVHTKQIHAVSKTHGYEILHAKSVILCMGCRERTRGAIAIPGTRPAGVFTAGTAQRYVNMEGYMVGKRVVILGSGDIGLIMARRMTLEGATVLACIELMPYSGGLTRNIVQCLHDYAIPLYLSHTITNIEGEQRVERVHVAQVDEMRRPIPGTELAFDCDTVLLSVGLIPENELTRGAGISMDARTNGAVVFEDMETAMPGVFACGNAVHVHDLVDFVTAESQLAGRSAATYVTALAGDAKRESLPDADVVASPATASPAPSVNRYAPTYGASYAAAAVSAARPHAAPPILALTNGDGVSYTVPQHIRLSRVEKAAGIFFRVRRVYGESTIVVRSGATEIARFKREHMAPGEMEHITLPRVLLNKADITQPLVVCVEERAPAAAQKGV